MAILTGGLDLCSKKVREHGVDLLADNHDALPHVVRLQVYNHGHHTVLSLGIGKVCGGEQGERKVKTYKQLKSRLGVLDKCTAALEDSDLHDISKERVEMTMVLSSVEDWNKEDAFTCPLNGEEAIEMMLANIGGYDYTAAVSILKLTKSQLVSNVKMHREVIQWTQNKLPRSDKDEITRKQREQNNAFASMCGHFTDQYPQASFSAFLPQAPVETNTILNIESRYDVLYKLWIQNYVNLRTHYEEDNMDAYFEWMESQWGGAPGESSEQSFVDRVWRQVMVNMPKVYRVMMDGIKQKILISSYKSDNVCLRHLSGSVAKSGKLKEIILLLVEMIWT